MVTGAARGLGNEFCKAFVDSYVGACRWHFYTYSQVNDSGCTSLAIVDLKQEEAEAAASELANYACGQSIFLVHAGSDQ